ncbi:MAG: histidine phosphatase family protein [Desulfosarcinaceae bacterium]|nr:histidine phosphatase family protein [Desulfosarcinaceae bacterium]
MTTVPTTTLMFIRHGETEWNRALRFQGHGDSPLTKTGRAQARALADRLADAPIDLLISSDLGRTCETASFIAATTGLAPTTDARLRERHYGPFEGLTIPEIEARHPEAYARFRTDDPDYVLPGGESHRQHYRRNIDFFQTHLQAHAGTTAALVAHGGVLDSLFRFLAQLPLDQPRCFLVPNTSLTIVKHGIFYGTSRWVMETWGDVSHLKLVERFEGL